MSKVPSHWRSIDRRSFMLGVAATTGIGLPAMAKPSRAVPLSDGRVALAKGDVVEAVLIGATTRYDHFVLGSRHEAAGVRVTISDGRQLELTLPSDSVFEDREPRIVDLDGDGRNEILLVHSRQSTGSALAVLGLRDGALKVIAETPPNGGPQRWLNPAGVGRFMSSDRRQVAMVRMPHVVGRLEFWEFDDTALTLKSSLDGVSNHRIGSPNLHMSAVIPSSDGMTDLLAVPNLDRRTLLLIDARGDRAKAVGHATLPSPADGNFTLVGSGADAELAVPLANGSVSRLAVSKILAAG